MTAAQHAMMSMSEDDRALAMMDEIGGFEDDIYDEDLAALEMEMADVDIGDSY